MPNPWDNDPIISVSNGGAVTVGTPRPRKKEVRQVGDQLGLVDPDTGQFTPTYAKPPKAQTEQKQIPATAAAGIQANLENLRAVDAALAALKSRPQSIGPGTGMLGDTFTQFHDPEGTDVRSRVGQLGAVKIHDLSGAAVSASEAPRFQPFVPTNQDRPEIAARKLQQFREALQAQIKESLDYYGPSNGYLPYKTPQADQFLQGAPKGRFGDDFGAPGTEIQFGDESGPRQFTPEQAAKDQAFLATKPSPEQYKVFLESLTGQPVTNAAERLKAAQQGGAYNPGIKDPRVQQLIDQKLQEGGGAGSAAVTGFGDAATLGSMDELGAAASALGGSLQGQGSFGDLYGLNVEANRGYENELQNQHLPSYLAGSLLGGAALPVGNVSGAADLAKIGAAYGGAYGFNSGQDSLANRLGGAATGAIAGGATGYGIGRAGQLLRGAPSGAVPELVDPATGALNQPLEAMSPGQRVQAANQFGVNLPLDAAGGRTAAIIGKGLDIMPGSAGVMEDARRATEQQVAAGADRVASGFGSARTLSEGGAELQRGAQERIQRGKDVAAKAYNAIPLADNAPAASHNAVAALGELTGRFQSNPELADAVKDPRLLRYYDALQKNGLSWRDLKDFRSLVGEKIGDMRYGEGHSTKDLRALYGALSEDMRDTAANASPGALKAFERANDLHRQNQNLIDGALTRILGPDGKLAPEKAAAAVQAMTKGGKSTGDLKTLAQIRAATVKSGAWNEIASTLIRLGGQPLNSAGRDFNPQTFVNWYADMAQPARNLLFGQGELRKSLDQFVAVNQRLMKVNALRNTSQTAGSMTAAGTVGVLGGMLLNPMLGVKVAAAGAGNFAMAKAWTNPAFVRWATGFSRAATPNAAKAQIGRLGKLATTNPELREPLVSLQRTLLSAINDNAPAAGGVAASPDQGPQNQTQPY